MHFNLIASPQSTELIGNKENGGLYIELPVYKDLLGIEFETIEKLDAQDAQWNHDLIKLADIISEERGLTTLEIAQVLMDLEGRPFDEKLDALGIHATAVNELLATKPSEARRSIELALLMIRRVNPGFHYEQAGKLPRTFIQQIGDFCYREQIGAKALPYADLLAKYNLNNTQVEMMQPVVKEALKLRGNDILKAGDMAGLKQALDAYGTVTDILGKPQTPTTENT